MSDVWSVAGGPTTAERTRLLCHDLRQPLAAIMLLCGTVPGEADPVVRARLREISSQAAVLAELIDSELEAPADREPDPGCEVADVLASVATTARLTYRGHLVLVTGTRPARVGMPAVALRRVVTNLVDNATRAAGPEGQVRVCTRILRARVVIDVEDDGPGWGRIESGYGLGLTYVREAVAAVGGRLTVSRTIRDRTQVRITLPHIGLGR